jgi:hypothetical protein
VTMARFRFLAKLRRRINARRQPPQIALTCQVRRRAFVIPRSVGTVEMLNRHSQRHTSRNARFFLMSTNFSWNLIHALGRSCC